ncbi:MAG: hypothetical protein HC896_12710 [Bacteroidales bacterium]|nr:hypothetical protein [Bacteroidales bacterium]
MNYKLLAKSSFSMGSSAIFIDYSGLENTPMAYEMLDGLKPGFNSIHDLRFTHRLKNGLEFSFQYQLRTNNKNRPVHTGGVEARMVLMAWCEFDISHMLHYVGSCVKPFGHGEQAI